MSAPKIIAVLGPTASGKTALAVELCRRLDGEAVSCDSMQIYRDMNIGTAKPTSEEMRGIPHHMLDICAPEEDYSVARYVREAEECINDILSRGKVPVIVGGTGLYADSLISGLTFAERQEDMELRRKLTVRYETEGGEVLHAELAKIDPTAAARLHPNDGRRIIRALEIYALTGETITEHDRRTRETPDRFDALRLVLFPEPRELLYTRIDMRVDAMLEEGLLSEVEELLARGLSPECTALQAIGYKEFVGALRGECTVAEAAEELKRATRRYAKRQLTWFRRNPAAQFLSYTDAEGFVACIDRAEALAREHLQRE
ncbi:MAG: tRNA (adenosine(37)-N6)-dimethylallyltransferase MiaA [Clostridia bacterium]|nr:tRNA (adenosine(37)-N6)-dimethylallyltransferase MiaA [Clostridia bacterium]